MRMTKRTTSNYTETDGLDTVMHNVKREESACCRQGYVGMDDGVLSPFVEPQYDSGAIYFITSAII